MTLASDRGSSSPQLSVSGQRMLALRDKVFQVWEARARERITQASKVQHPVLIDTLPVFYDNIAQSISPDYPRTSGVDGNTLAAEHGGERARITSYDHAALIEEYQIFRRVIFDVLREDHIVLNHEELHTINFSIDSAIQEAVAAFSLVHSGFRERFAAALTHDMRGPLSAAMTGLELILISKDQERIKTFAVKALSSVQRVSGMIDELLNTMAFHSGEKIQLALGQIDISEVVKEVQADVFAEHAPRIHSQLRSIIGYWDRAALERAVENLLSNAIKYGKPDTPIEILMDEVHGRLLLSVHNEGPPISPDDQECIFQMYRRAESAMSGSSEGWGIGLPYVRAVAESHGGSIGLDSSIERGTTFSIDIPIDARNLHGTPTLKG